MRRLSDFAKADCSLRNERLDRRDEDIFIDGIFLLCAPCTCVASHCIASHLKLVNVTSIRPGHSRTTGRRTRVRVNDVHSEAHVARISTLTAWPPREAHRGFAAAIVKKLDVSAAEVTVRHAVEQIVEAGLGQGEPGQVVEHTRTNSNKGIHANCQAKWQPEYDEHYAAAHICLRELVVPGEGGWRFIRASCGSSYTYHQFHIEEDRHQSW